MTSDEINAKIEALQRIAAWAKANNYIPVAKIVSQAVGEARGLLRKSDSATYQPPSAAKNNARRVLEWRRKYGDAVKGMTRVGWTRANQLASGGPVSADVVKRMAQFNRHRKNATVAPEHKDEPWKDAGHVAWLGWGGDAGVNWAIRESKAMKG